MTERIITEQEWSGEECRRRVLESLGIQNDGIVTVSQYDVDGQFHVTRLRDLGNGLYETLTPDEYGKLYTFTTSELVDELGSVIYDMESLHAMMTNPSRWQRLKAAFKMIVKH